jgi:hypothetical protein
MVNTINTTNMLDIYRIMKETFRIRTLLIPGLDGSAVPSVGENTPPFHRRPVALPRALASSAPSICVAIPAVRAKSRHFAHPANWLSS